MGSNLDVATVTVKLNAFKADENNKALVEGKSDKEILSIMIDKEILPPSAQYLPIFNFGDNSVNYGLTVEKSDVQVPYANPDATPLSEFHGTAAEEKECTKMYEAYGDAYSAFKIIDAQQGWAGEVANAARVVFGADNTRLATKKALDKASKQYQELKEAGNISSEAFQAKFKELFGVEYNEQNIAVFEVTKQLYSIVSAYKQQQEQYANAHSLLLENKPLSEETTYVQSSSTVGASGQYQVIATKEQVFEREFNKLAQEIGESVADLDELRTQYPTDNEFNAKLTEIGAKFLNEYFEKSNMPHSTMEEKFEILKDIAQKTYQSYDNGINNLTDNKGFDGAKAEYDEAYQTAYGTKNDLMKQVDEFNIAQQKGAGRVKSAVSMAAVIGVSVATGGLGVVGTAGLAAGTTALVEGSNELSKKENIQVLKDGGSLGDYFKAVGENGDWKSIAKATISSGAMMLAIGGITYPIANLVRLGATATGLTGKALDIATGIGTNAAVSGTMLGATKLMKGEVTTEDAIFVVVMAIVGSTIQVIQINKAYNLAAEAKEAQLMQDIAQARETMGFKEGEQITPELLKQRYHDLAKANHSDVTGGTDTQMALINGANDILEANLAKANGIDVKLASKIMKAAQQTDYDATTVERVMNENPDLVTELAQATDANGKTLFSAQDISDILYNCQHGFTEDGVITNWQAKTRAVINNPEEVANISGWKSKGGGVWRAIQDPLNSTVEANPAAFGVKATATKAQAPAQAQTSTSTEVPVSSRAKFNPEGKTETQIKIELSKYANDNNLTLKSENNAHNLYDSAGKKVLTEWTDYAGGHHVNEYNYTENGGKLSETQYSNGETDYNIEYHYDSEGNIKYSTKTSYYSKADGTSELRSDLAIWEDGKGIRQGQGVSYTPEELSSQYGIKVNTEIFETVSSTAPAQTTSVNTELETNIMKAAQKASYDATTVERVMNENPDLVTELAQATDANGKTLFSAQDISDILYNCQHGFTEDGVITNWQAKVRAVINNPEEVASFAGWKSKGGGVWRAIQDPLNSTTEANPAAFGVGTSASQAPAVQSKPATISGSKAIVPDSMRPTTGKIGAVEVTVASGDLTGIKADAYLVPEFTNCVSEGGVGGAVWRKGAGVGMQAYEKYVAKNGAQDFGSVVVTESGGGNSSKLIHAVTVGSGAENEFQTVQTAVYNALKEAQAQGMQSIAIPELGTGIIGSLTGEQSAQAIMAGINQFNAEGGTMDVALVIYGSQGHYNTFVETMNTQAYANAKPVTGTKEFDVGAWVKGMQETINNAEERIAETTIKAKAELAQEPAYESPEVRVSEIKSNEPVHASSDEGQYSSLAERASLKYKNTILNPKAKASVEVLSDKYNCDIEILPNGKANIGGQEFNVGELDKSGVAEIVRSTFDSSYKPSSASISAKQQNSPEVTALRSAIKEAYGTGEQAQKAILKQRLSGDSDRALLANWNAVSENSVSGKVISELLTERGYIYDSKSDGWDKAPAQKPAMGLDVAQKAQFSTDEVVAKLKDATIDNATLIELCDAAPNAVKANITNGQIQTLCKTAEGLTKAKELGLVVTPKGLKSQLNDFAQSQMAKFDADYRLHPENYTIERRENTQIQMSQNSDWDGNTTTITNKSNGYVRFYGDGKYGSSDIYTYNLKDDGYISLTPKGNKNIKMNVGTHKVSLYGNTLKVDGGTINDGTILLTSTLEPISTK